MRKSKKVFLFFGLPLLIFMGFIAVIYYVLHTLWYFTIAGLILISMYRKERKYITLTKLAIILFLWFAFMCINPLYWGQQIYRRLDRGSLITPDAQCIIDLNATFVASPFYHGPYNRSTLQGQMDELSDVQNFLYNPGNNPNDYIDYVYDFFQYPGVFDHVPSAEEVLANRQDDCDGIAVVTVSLLVRLGYEAYIAESDSHWWTYVKIYGEDLNSSIRGTTSTVVYLNWWEQIGDPYMIFNQTTVIITQPLYYSWYDQMTDGYYIEILQEFGGPYVAFTPIVALLLGFLFSIGVGFPRHYPKKRMYLANTLLVALVTGLLLLSLIYLPSPLRPYGILFLLGTLGVLIYVIERDYFTKWLWKLK
ncbi:MAG: hypothetical protein ACTSRS_09745 [Candidatus Helarchaeota archaeon]